jgi:pimeloyl-ACP methyl ester carboxylesterase
MSYVELVQVRTADGVRLDGALSTPKHVEAGRKPPVDALLAVHGTGSNFYSSGLFEGLVPKLLADGLTVLRVNTRGHDVVSMAATLQGSRRMGSSLERVDDCTHDLVAWTEFLVSRGHSSIGLVGHSLGAIKAVYTMTHTPHPAVKRLIAISPPRLSHEYYVASEKREEFLAHLRQAEQLVAAGQGETLINIHTPLPFLVSAASFIDKYGPAEKYNFLRHVDRLKVPALFTFGGIELEEVNFRGLPEAMAAATSPTQNIQVVTIAGANHVYTGQIEELAYKIRSWLAATT